MPFATTAYAATILLVVLSAAFVFRLWHQNKKLRKALKIAHQDAEAILRNSDHALLASEHASDGIVIHDMQGRVTWANPAYLKIFGVDFEDIKGKHPMTFAVPEKDRWSQEDAEKFHYATARPDDTQLHKRLNVRANGEEFWNQMNVSFGKKDDGTEVAILVCRDISEQVNTETKLREISEQLQHEATHDGLTGAANRNAFLDFTKDVLGRADQTPVGLLQIDLDKFKQINDTHGHPVGDAVLVHTARALKDNVRSGDLVARVGGDEFVVVCPNISTPQDLLTLANHLSQQIARPFASLSNVLTCKASIGAALSEDTNTTTSDLLLWSDIALYDAKRGGRNQVAVYDKDLKARQEKDTLFSKEVSQAVEGGVFDFHFQPIMCLHTNSVIGLETLARWHHPDKGLLAPNAFLPKVRELGLMPALDLQSMTAALRQKARLNELGHTAMTIAFNASPELLSHPDFISRLIWGVEAGEIDRSQLVIEVTETANFGDVVENSSQAAIVRDLRRAGFQVHLDDFGKGFAGLSRFSQLNVSGIKIDPSLVNDIENNNVSFKIVRKIIELCNELDLAIVADGVENKHLIAILGAMGCTVMQGDCLSEPITADALPDWLSQNAHHVAKLRA